MTIFSQTDSPILMIAYAYNAESRIAGFGFLVSDLSQRSLV